MLTGLSGKLVYIVVNIYYFFFNKHLTLNWIFVIDIYSWLIFSGILQRTNIHINIFILLTDIDLMTDINEAFQT